MAERRRLMGVSKEKVLFEKTFYPAGTYSWVVPAGCTSVDVFLVGGGGGSQAVGGVYKSGASGGYTKTYKASDDGYKDGEAISVTPGEVISIIVGAGGSGANAGGYSQFKNSNYRANGGGAAYVTDSSVITGYTTDRGGSGGGGFSSSGAMYSGGSDGSTPTYGGSGQGHTTRDFGESDGLINAGGGGAEGKTGGSGRTTGAGTSPNGYGGGGYGGGAGAANDEDDGVGGDGVVMIRFYAYSRSLLFTERITTTGTYIVPAGAKRMDIFLVGGGGGGGAWDTWYCEGGMPGTGGGCTLSSFIRVTPGESFSVNIGAGGSKASSHIAGAYSAKDGGTTSLTYNNITYEAPGGKGGRNGTTNDNWTTFIKSSGVSQYYGGYYNGNIMSIKPGNGEDGVYFPDGSSVAFKYYYNSGIGTEDNPYYSTKSSIPEFFEEGQPTHATCGTMDTDVIHDTTYGGINPVLYTDDSYDMRVYTAGGYGSGGSGGNYANTTLKYGFNGNPGIAVIRWYK